MQNKLMISIIDENGSKQFSMHKIMQKVALFSALGILSIMILYFIMAHFLMSELEGILEKNTLVRENFQSIYEKNSELERNIDYKTSELLKVSTKVNELENIVNIRKSGAQGFNNQDIDLSSLTALQKDMILKIIPNGNPLEEFTSKSFPSKSSTLYSLAQSAPVHATANGIIDSVRVGGSADHYIQIQHSYGFKSNFGHLSKVTVQKGDFVTKGQVIGYAQPSNNLYYDLRFLETSLDMASYTDWNLENFAQVVDSSNAIDWKSLVWALDDIIQLKNYRVSFQD